MFHLKHYGQAYYTCSALWEIIHFSKPREAVLKGICLFILE